MTSPVFVIRFKALSLGFAILGLVVVEGVGDCTGDKLYLKKNPYLPDWCRYTFDGNINLPNSKRFIELYGDGWYTMHHFCRGLNWIDEAFSEGNAKKRDFNLWQAVDNFDYVLDRTSSAFRFRPDVLYRKGEVLQLLKRKSESIVCFQEVIRLRPNFAQGYLALSHAYLSLKMIREAKEVIESGLKVLPENEDLKLKLKELE